MTNEEFIRVSHSPDSQSDDSLINHHIVTSVHHSLQTMADDGRNWLLTNSPET